MSVPESKFLLNEGGGGLRIELVRQSYHDMLRVISREVSSIVRFNITFSDETMLIRLVVAAKLVE